MQSVWRAGLALAVVVAMTTWPARIAAEDGEREQLTNALQQLQAQLLLSKSRAKTDGLSRYLEEAIRNAEYLQDKARLWKPKRRDDGRHLREAIQLLSNTLGLGSQGSIKQDSSLLFEAFGTLAQIALYCKLMGLTAEPTVSVRTKRGGREEVKGLEVRFLERFVAMVNPNAMPHRFSQFSSPVKDKLLPGRYWFWASDPSTGKAGPIAEGCVCEYNPGRWAQTLYNFEISAP